MKQLKNFYNTISTVFVLMALLIIAFLIFGYSMLSDLQSTIAEVKLRIIKVSDTDTNLLSLEKRFEAIKPELEKINKALPDKKDSSLLISDINSIANQNGLKLTLIQSTTFGKKTQSAEDPSLLQTIKGKNSYEIPLEIKVEGSYNSFSSFIKALENYQRIINISAIEVVKLTNEEALTNKIEAKIKLTAYLKK